MHRWSYIRKKLEADYLAPSLRGHIQYYVTTYSKDPDRNGRAAIRFDGQEVLHGSYYGDARNAGTWEEILARGGNFAWKGMQVDDFTLKTGTFDQNAFYGAFEAFDNQSIDESLQSDNLLVRIFALLDRRCGKRRLAAMQEEMKAAPPALRTFYRLRCDAEGLRLEEEAAS
ncbi:MAG: hypothetical protein IJK64_07560 [Clostridia bacterium]|nr:hypothetical protein [Clostridia bacterium]